MIECYEYHQVDAQIQKVKERLIYDIKVVYADPSQFFEKLLQKIAQETNRFSAGIIDENIDFWSDFVNSPYTEIQVGFVKEVMKEEYKFNSIYAHFPKVLEIAMSIDSRFTKDKLTNWLVKTTAWETELNQGFWNKICTALSRNMESIDVNLITQKIDLGILEAVTFSEGQLAILNQCRFFNKSILNSGNYIFKVDYNSILNNNGRRESEAIQWFDYVRWDDDTLLSNLNSAIYEIKRIIQRQSTKSYGSMEKSGRRHFEEIILKNKAKILELGSESLEPFVEIYEIAQQ
ncbi:hypothetical protein [Paenibacillus amylolyticus]|uniref:hypothetical protein n=1 Tax=Paenibacillus amylolyticus TaxID=1451 RepID=UPI003242A325